MLKILKGVLLDARCLLFGHLSHLLPLYFLRHLRINFNYWWCEVPLPLSWSHLSALDDRSRFRSDYLAAYLLVVIICIDDCTFFISAHHLNKGRPRSQCALLEVHVVIRVVVMLPLVCAKERVVVVDSRS